MYWGRDSPVGRASYRKAWRRFDSPVRQGFFFFLLEFTFSTSLWVFYSLRVQSHAPTFVRTLKSITPAATPLFGLFSCTTFVWIHENTAQRLEWVGLLYYIQPYPGKNFPQPINEVVFFVVVWFVFLTLSLSSLSLYYYY